MKVALMLTGLARKVEEGYKHYWKYIIDNHDVDLYLHCWQDEELMTKVHNWGLQSMS